MEKYSKVAELTKKYLFGTLDKMTIEYIDKGFLHVSILYEDSFEHRYDYDLNINPKNSETQFLSHISKNPLIKVSLAEDSQFENEICSFLCKSLQ